MAHVSALAVLPVKALQVVDVDALELGPQGAVGDRAFLLTDPTGAVLDTRRAPALLGVAPAHDSEAGTLRLAFPDGTVVEAPVEPAGAELELELLGGRRTRGRRVPGPHAEALSELLGREVVLVARTAADGGWDDYPLTLQSEASLAALADALPGAGALDGRRFRMNITVRGLDPWEEDGWRGREVAVADAVLRVVSPTERCVVTTRDPRTGARDHAVLAALARLRGRDDVCFGVWAEVARPGRVALGDPVARVREGRRARPALR